MKRVAWWLFGGVFLAMSLVLLGLLVSLSGVIPIKASSGHWRVTAWFLELTMRRSVATHSLGVKLPPIDDERLVAIGAGHFHGGCRPCHGSPERPSPVIASSMTPAAPSLVQAGAKTKPEELFTQVKHGIKFTGMPAWPAQERDDEVHAVVAFLKRLPRLDAAGYGALVWGAAPPDSRMEPVLAGLDSTRLTESGCARCHGVDGLGRELGAFPKLAGQRVEYLFQSMKAYAERKRPSGIMGPIAAALSEDEWRKVSEVYAGMKMGLGARVSSEVTAGERIARVGIPAQGVPACIDCHGPSEHRRNPVYPELAGQDARYLIQQLELFKRGVRGGTPYSHLMGHVATRLSEEQMRQVAEYFEGLPMEGS